MQPTTGGEDASRTRNTFRCVRFQNGSACHMPNLSKLAESRRVERLIPCGMSRFERGGPAYAQALGGGRVETRTPASLRNPRFPDAVSGLLLISSQTGGECEIRIHSALRSAGLANSCSAPTLPTLRGADEGLRTPMLSRRLLRTVCIPVPPHRHISILVGAGRLELPTAFRPPVPKTGAFPFCYAPTSWSIGWDFNPLTAILQTAGSSFAFRYMVPVNGVEPILNGF